ncbi:MAG TPA: HAMP domain-containing sensor histidine kinase [Candidatus Dormibacteraeota bacterium]|jgi:signal transduction histidine kinase|nr:HAMP domain-containing sensor histidine kinase [Candidatus Dormibacteraeota bacterium]
MARQGTIVTAAPSQGSRLAEVLAGLDQACVVVDAAGRVVESSGPIDALIGATPAAGSLLAETLRGGEAEGAPVFAGEGSHLARAGAAGGVAWRSPLRGVDVEVDAGPRVLGVALRPLASGETAVYLSDGAQLREILEAQDALISITSHELKTPLTAIKAMAELMISYDLGEAQRKEMTGDIYRQAERLEQLIREILDASQLDSGRMPLDLQPTRLKDVLAEVVEELETQMEGRKLTVKLPADMPLLMVDWAKLSQVLVNLLTNAVKYSPEGAPVAVRAMSQNGMVRVEVRDQGIGIRAEDQGRLFKKFQRIQDAGGRRTPGTGLGLYIVKGLVELMGGAIEVSSKHGQGSTFAFTVPAWEAPR